MALEKSGTEKISTEKTGIEKTGIEKTGIEKTGIEKTGTENINPVQAVPMQARSAGNGEGVSDQPVWRQAILNVWEAMHIKIDLHQPLLEGQPMFHEKSVVSE